MQDLGFNLLPPGSSQVIRTGYRQSPGKYGTNMTAGRAHSEGKRMGHGA